jgi:pimeloyl-ACP methyl ester carboxylesterase
MWTTDPVAAKLQQRRHSMATFVLVHGAWHGGWCWKKVTPLLRAAGHEVYTPTLTGLGERSHLATPEVNLTTHIQDVVNVLDYEDLHGVVLVGHSYGGIVIAGVADRMPSRVGHLVYLDAGVPHNGEAYLDLLPNLRAPIEESCRLNGDGWWVPPPTKEMVLGWAGTADLPWLMGHLTAQPIKTVQEPVHLASPSLAGIPATYIHCTDPATPVLAESVARAKQSGWTCRKLATGHDAMVTRPRELADLFLAVARPG